ncbi:sushi domain-containing protein 1 [Plakobranchus ocellatus]|uniref:Sushi domain-containing protein 1 n=1 Tax=Plakobranchus ocellatus TaxID=259542 RepID=A0AAV3ZA66_9GAST|nr:sushi domain-containing protein 1 [Plakobranchus ocellatus]
MIGYTGKSRFVQCQSSGQWSSVEGYTGCTPVDCGIPTPTVQHGTPTVTGTTYGAAVIYTCEPGYKASTPGANVTCLADGKWDTPTFTCDKVSIPQREF